MKAQEFYVIVVAIVATMIVALLAMSVVSLDVGDVTPGDGYEVYVPGDYPVPSLVKPMLMNVHGESMTPIVSMSDDIAYDDIRSFLND